jgi:hypothetical protein
MAYFDRFIDVWTISVSSSRQLCELDAFVPVCLWSFAWIAASPLCRRWSISWILSVQDVRRKSFDPPSVCEVFHM